MTVENMLDQMDALIDSMMDVDFSALKPNATVKVRHLIMDRLGLALFGNSGLPKLITALDVDVSDNIYNEHQARVEDLADRFAAAIIHAYHGLSQQHGHNEAILMLTSGKIEFHLKS